MTLTLGPPMIFIPVLQAAAEYMGWTALPIGYERVEAVGECPLVVETEEEKP